MSTCKACGRSYRKGVRALVHFPSGTVSTTVCPVCARRGLLLVAQTLPPVEQVRAVRAPDFAKAIRMLTTYSRAAEASARSQPADHVDHHRFMGRCEGFESAIETLRAIEREGAA